MYLIAVALKYTGACLSVACHSTKGPALHQGLHRGLCFTHKPDTPGAAEKAGEEPVIHKLAPALFLHANTMATRDHTFVNTHARQHNGNSGPHICSYTFDTLRWNWTSPRNL